jgi:hypothetical protein
LRSVAARHCVIAATAELASQATARADLTLAALAAPMWDPPEHAMRWPPEDIWPPEVSALRARFVGTRAHDHVLRMYRQHRLPLQTGRPVASQPVNLDGYSDEARQR